MTAHELRRPGGWKFLVPSCVYCLNCTKFGSLILRKIINIVATRCQILRLKLMHQIRWGELTAPEPLAGFGGERKGEGGKVGGKGRRGEGNEREGA